MSKVTWTFYILAIIATILTVGSKWLGFGSTETTGWLTIIAIICLIIGGISQIKN